MLCTGEFRGLWTRSLIAWPDGQRDVSTRVTWLQSFGLFADLRQKPGLFFGLSGATCRNELTAEDCLALAGQQGFSGKFEARDGAYEWVRRIDLQPPQATRDIGRLFWRSETLVEEGVEREYTEHWHRDATDPESVSAGLWLHDAARNVSGCVLRVGGWFAYARGRAAEIAGDGLVHLVEGAESLARMQALVDCEISFGRVTQDWRITRSSLPYRLGNLFGARMQVDRLVLPDLDEAGQRIERVWEITEQEGDSSVILDTTPKNF